MKKITAMMVVCVILAYFSEKQTEAFIVNRERYSVWKDPAFLALALVMVLFAGLRTAYNDSLLSSKRQKIYV